MSSLNSNWRKTATTLYTKPADSKILGSAEIDITNLDLYIAEQRKKGIKLTPTLFFTLVVARAIKEDIPEMNTYVKRGNIHEFKQIDASVSVLLPDGTMSSAKVKNADQLTVETCITQFNKQVQEIKKGFESKTMDFKDKLAAIPWPLDKALFYLIKKCITSWGIYFPSLSLTPEVFGSFMVSNIGTLGLDIGYPALMPASNVSIVLILGGAEKKPVVVNDQIVIRKIMKIGAALDHRVVDASHGGKLFRHLKLFASKPHLIENR